MISSAPIACAAALFLITACAGTTKDAKLDSACPNQTGSRIPVNPSTCSAPGRAYSSDDIKRTGATTAGGALRLIDPSVTVHQ